MATRRRWIHTQGDLDGACFLYAVANAYTALTRETPDLADWGRRSRRLPHVADFIDGAVGTTEHYDGSGELLAAAARSLLESAPNQRPLQVVPHGTVESLVGVGELVGPESVAVINYKGRSLHATGVDHWVCAVAFDPARDALEVACSIRWSDVYRFSDDEYAETEHPNGRRSNDVLTAPKARIVPDTVLQIVVS